MNQLFTFFPAQIPLDHPDTVKSCALPYFLAFPTETFIAGMMQITQSSKYDFDCWIILGVQLVSISTHWRVQYFCNSGFIHSWQVDKLSLQKQIQGEQGSQ